MKNIISALLLSLSAAVLAIDMPKDPEKDGGMVKLTGAGKIGLVDCCGLARADLRPVLNEVDMLLNMKVEVSRTDGFSFKDSEAAFKATGANVAVFIVRDTALPFSLVAPEGKWGIVNVAALAGNGEGLFRSRLNLLVFRTLCRVLGAGAARDPGSSNYPCHDLKSLDGIKTLDPSFDALISANEGMKLLGMEQYVYGTYRDACEMDEAPAPTNAVQRAIAEEMKKRAKKGK